MTSLLTAVDAVMEQTGLDFPAAIDLAERMLVQQRHEHLLSYAISRGDRAYACGRYVAA